MNKTKLFSIILLAATVILAVVSFLLLPETVVTQLSFGGDPTTMPKIAAVALPSLLGAGGAVAGLAAKGDDKTRKKCLLVSAVGILIFAVMLLVNLAG